MTDKWRLIDMRIENAATQMAIDEAIAAARTTENNPNTLRLYRWNPSAVSVGYFQSIMNEVDTEACKKYGVDVVRRITGGGAVFHDYNGEITYSLVAPDDDPKIPEDIISSYRLICDCIIQGLKDLGIDSEFKPINDIIAGGKKISGNAQTRRYGVILQHGTILVDCDVKKIFSVLKVSGVKISDKAIKSAEERVTSLKKIIGSDLTFDEVKYALIKGFENVLNMKLLNGDLTNYENELKEKYLEKYRSPEWVYQR
ncbi:lipoate--protein ligase family protein [Candidatus Bathyarchaeota archaeon]|nr:lipoate--protein ligase family protein [Candidatus Bathyarchaeota archaeon]